MNHRYFSSLFFLVLLAIGMLPQALMARNDIPAFCYHQVEPKASGRFSLSSARFREQLEYLRARNYKSLNSAELLEAVKENNPATENTVVITFDDGYKTVYDHAYPIMKEMGFKGIICIYPSFIGSRLAMSWDQLKELISEGWSVECHSMTHSNLAGNYADINADRAFLEKEIISSRNLIEKKLGNKVLFMVWPYGVYTDRSLKTAKDAGFAGAMTVDGGANYRGISPWQIKRQVIYSTDDMSKFLLRFGMRGMRVSEHYPEPGKVLGQLATFSCRLDDLHDFSRDKYVMNAKVTGKSVKFDFDQETRTLKAEVGSAFKPGNYFIDIYLRDKKTGITAQHGWLFTIGGKSSRSTY